MYGEKADELSDDRKMVELALAWLRLWCFWTGAMKVEKLRCDVDVL